MQISRIFEGVEVCSSFREADIEVVSCDSRTCTPGSLFIAVRGADADGHTFIGKAIENGAKHIACEEIPQEVKDKEVQL